MKERDVSNEFSDRVDYPYWAGLASGVLRVQRCAVCSRWQWPADWRCPACGSYEFHWPEVEATGTVYSWIRTHYPFVPGYDDLLPYVSVLVELPQAGGARMMGLLSADDSDPHIGDPLAGTFEPASSATQGLAVLRWQKLRMS